MTKIDSFVFGETVNCSSILGTHCKGDVHKEGDKILSGKDQ